MTMTLTAARGAVARDQPLTSVPIQRREVAAHDVELDIAFCGVCHSDVDKSRELRGVTRYPVVPGHEIVGTVAKVGPDVTRHQPGDRVAVGCIVDSCRECDRCRDGLEQYCRKGNIQTYNWIGRDGEITQGGFSERIVVDENYVLRLPEGMSMPHAAPLLCAGITLYSPLRHWNVGPASRIGIVGFGGLGHVGVQLAAALGAHTTVFEIDEAKRDDALRLGASDFRLTTDRTAFADLADSLDLIISTVPARLDYDALLGLLTLDGTFVNIGVPGDPVQVQAFNLISHRRSISGTRTGSLRETQEMLDFCAEHGIGAEIELIDADFINDAFDRLMSGDVRYRFVIDMSTLTD